MTERVTIRNEALLEEAAKIAEQTVSRLTEVGPAGATYSGYVTVPRWEDGPIIARAIRAKVFKT